MADRAEQAALLTLVSHTDGEWYKTATLVEEAGGALRIVHGDYSQLDGADATAAEELGRRVSVDEIDRYVRRIQEWTESGVRLVTVLDEEYPINLREIHNRPPFLFVRGHLRPEDGRAIAVVGTRSASDGGLLQARQLSGDLARRGVTVLSGMALGIDTAAHEGALEAGGRTLAVFGTGINHIYPPPMRDSRRASCSAGHTCRSSGRMPPPQGSVSPCATSSVAAWRSGPPWSNRSMT